LYTSLINQFLKYAAEKINMELEANGGGESEDYSLSGEGNAGGETDGKFIAILDQD